MTTLLQHFFDEATVAFKPGEWSRVAGELKQTTPAKLARRLKLLLPQLLLYYVLLAPVVATPLYNLMLFHPTMSGPFAAHKIVGQPIENVAMSSANGTQLHGWYLAAPGATRVVLISHGNGENLTNRIPLVAMFLRAGVSVFIYDYQGYGKSSGSPGLDKICQDGEVAYAWLTTKKGYAGNNIIVFGESLGSGVACEIARTHKVAGIILTSPFSALHELASQKILWLRLYPSWLCPKPELNNVAVLEQPHAPVLIIHGQKDHLIPPQHSDLLYQRALPPKTLVKLPDAGHNDIYYRNVDEYSVAVGKFLKHLPAL